jgi:hypothetical protein
MGKGKFLALPGLELPSLGRPVSISTTLPRLFVTNSTFLNAALCQSSHKQGEDKRHSVQDIDGIYEFNEGLSMDQNVDTNSHFVSLRADRNKLLFIISNNGRSQNISFEEYKICLGCSYFYFN